MTWPQAVFYSIFVICLALITLRGMTLIAAVGKRRTALKALHEGTMTPKQYCSCVEQCENSPGKCRLEKENDAHARD